MNPNFKLFHTLTRHVPEDHGEWTGLTGRVSMEMLKNCGFPAPADDVFILCTGPKGFNATIRGFLKDNGYVEGEHFI